MKKLSKLLVAGVLALGLVGCGGSSNSGTDEKTITVGATQVPHAQILNDVVKDKLAEDGWTLEVVEFTDYVQPNTALEEGELDANYFQTLAYMEEENKERGLHLVNVAGIHYEAMGVYSKDIKTLDELKSASHVSIAVPNDGTNELRALKLLEANGIIELVDDANESKGLANVKDNKGVEIVELEAANITNNLTDVTAAVVNGNYALEADLANTANTLAAENFTTEEAAPYVNYLVVKEGSEDSEKTKALISALQSEEVKAYVSTKYGSAVVATF